MTRDRSHQTAITLVVIAGGRLSRDPEGSYYEQRP